MRRLVVLLLAAIALLAMPLATLPAFAAVAASVPAGPVHADSPITLDRNGQITDKVNALGGRRDEVRVALDKLDTDHNEQLFVAYVRDFSGKSPTDWANETATKNGLGAHDILLAVATHARQYGYSTDAASGVTSAQMNSIAAVAIEPALRVNDWAGAAIGAATGIGATLSGQPVPPVAVTPGVADPGGSGSGVSTAAIVGTVAVVGAVGAGAFVYTRSRRERGGTASHSAGGVISLGELDSQAKHALVATDDAVRTSEEELGFATAEFGDEAAAPFAAALAEAKSDLTAAFRLRQALDDEIPEDDATRRRMLTEIVQRCARANKRLDAEVKSFDRLRALVKQAPQALGTVERAIGEQKARVAPVEALLQRIAASYAPSATAPIADHPPQIADRLTFVDDSIGAARIAVDAADNRRAAVLIRAAEAGIEQAQLLLDAIDRRAAELDSAAEKLPQAIAEMETDLADARGLASNSASAHPSMDLAGRAARAEAVIAALRQEMTGRYDPLDALRRAEEADALLDEALDHVREQEVNDRRARSLLEQTGLTARSEIAAAEDFIATRRGAVGSQARTRLAEAKRHLQQSAALAATDPSAALGHAQQADSMAREALSLAQNDAGGYQSPYGNRQGGSLNGAVLGGIILGGMFGGGGSGGRQRGGGFDGGGFGGGSPGSFGGGSTRGRLGGGGRF